MNIAEKFGRWFVAAAWIAAGGYCLLNAGIGVTLARELHAPHMIVQEDVIYACSGLAFLAAAFGVVRHYRWARQLSFGLWALLGYWDLGAFGQFADRRWFPLLGFALFVVALFWLVAPTAQAQVVPLT